MNENINIYTQRYYDTDTAKYRYNIIVRINKEILYLKKEGKLVSFPSHRKALKEVEKLKDEHTIHTTRR